MKKENKKYSWREEPWEKFLGEFWDKRKTDVDFVEYDKKDLEKFLSQYTKSGQGEIRTFHYEHEKLKAVKKRNVSKIPISRSKWRIIKASPVLNFVEPKLGGKFELRNELTEGMIIGIKETFNEKTNPGETTLLAIANHVGLIADFYNLKENGILFTGGRQRAGINLIIDGHNTDMEKAQIEIDGGFEWANTVVIVEMKSTFKQQAFDMNQALIPMLKWKKLLKNKKVNSLVLLAETTKTDIEYWAFDLLEDEKTKMRINKSKKYIINVN
ncbi:DUF6997 domain-containing protein [Patescibacteria group bacterium]